MRHIPLFMLLCLQDDGSEHPHRVCLSVRADVTPSVMEKIQQRVQQAGLQVRARAAPGSRGCWQRMAEWLGWGWGAVLLDVPRRGALALAGHQAGTCRVLSTPACLPLTSAPLTLPHHALLPQVKVIVSGVGDWRYVDVTSARAGKLAALEYVRQLYGVHHSRCVAAGDSGNDTLMLGGRNLAIGEGGGGFLRAVWAGLRLHAG
jgi:hypothetical protein